MDTRNGRELADELSEYMDATDDILIFEKIINDMCCDRSDSGVRTGFLMRIAELSRRPRHLL